MMRLQQPRVVNLVIVLEALETFDIARIPHEAVKASYIVSFGALSAI